MFVNELSKSENSTFAKLRTSSHDLHIEKRVGIERPYLVKGNAFYVAWLLKMRNILLWIVTHFQHIEIFFDDFEQIVPSFSSKNVDEKFILIIDYEDYDIVCVCIKIFV